MKHKLIIILVFLLIGSLIWGGVITMKYNKLKTQTQTQTQTQTENLPEKCYSFTDLIKNFPKGLKPQKWGPPVWYSLHAMAFGYTDNPTQEEKFQAYNFFVALPYMIPCSKCGKHCKNYILNTPPEVESKHDLTNWLVNFHNDVNKRTGSLLVSYDELQDHFQENAMCGGAV